MTAILKFCQQILVAVLGNSDLTKRILQTLGLPAQEDSLQLVLTDSNALVADVGSSVYGLGALHDQITAVSADVATVNSLVTSVLAILDPWQVSGVPLPDPPPAGYGGGASAGDVWGYPIFVGSVEFTMAEIMLQLAYLQVMLASWSLEWDPGAPLFWLKAGVQAYNNSGYSDLPNPQTTAILADDTRMTWLEREASAWDWQFAAGNDEAIYAQSTSSDQFFWWLQMSEGEFDVIKAAMFGSGSSSGAPLWPGIANVTLGSPVALDVGLTITQPMDGVVVEITSVPSKQGQFDFDTAISWRNIGALSFFTDDGDQEFPQTLGFANCVYCPQSMVTAGGVRARTSAGVVGTITPWTRS